MSELEAPFHVTGGYLGQPGARTFFLQAADETTLVTVLVEKSQVDGLGDLLARVLAEIDESPVTDWDRDAMELREPVQPRWRVGTIGVGVDAEAGRVIVELNEMPTEDAAEDDATTRVFDSPALWRADVITNFRLRGDERCAAASPAPDAPHRPADTFLATPS